MRLSDIPPCVAVCPGDAIPMAPNDTDLQLKYVIPRSDPKTMVNYTDYVRDNRRGLFSGDRLVYQCLTESWGVYGGVDRVHDSFRFYKTSKEVQAASHTECFSLRCKDDGEYDAPNPNDIWPRCSPQQNSRSTVYLEF